MTNLTALYFSEISIVCSIGAKEHEFLSVGFDSTEIDIRFVPVLFHAALKGKCSV